MTSVTKSGVTTTYTYNALGQRVTKTTAGNTTYFVYDEAGHILGEYDNAGSLIEEIAWMYDIPVASIRFGSCGLAVFYIHTDHLNTPRRITKRSTNEIVWRWDSDAFGTTQANENPSGLGVFAFNLRFPGQYFDSETGLHYNYYRDGYDPATGRYAQSDPIGLYGGINTYAYVSGNPLSRFDPLGLVEICKQLRILDQKAQERRNIERTVLARIPWLQGRPTGISVGPSEEYEDSIGSRGRYRLGPVPGLPDPSVSWSVQFGWLEKQELTEYITWTQYHLWRLKCEETSYDECGNANTRYWFDEKWYEADRSRDRGNIWTEWNFVPTTGSYIMEIPGL
jgi:RHS repeat-associated protein